MSGVNFSGSVIVLPGGTASWPLTSMDDISKEALSSVLDVASSLDVFLLGCGAQMQLLNRDLRTSLREGGLAVDAMETGAACRSYNVLVTEGRSVAAALIAI